MTLFRRISTEDEYDEALAALEALMLQDDSTPDDNRDIETLAILLQEYEERVLPPISTTALAAIRFRMDQQDLEPKDLIPALGSRSRVSEVLNGKRPLSLRQIQRLHVLFGIPLEPLVMGERPVIS